MANYHKAKFTLRGNIAKKDVRSAGDLKICEVLVATDITEWDSDAEEESERTEWHNVVFFGGAAKYIEQYSEVGDTLCVTTTPYTSKWEDDDGNTRYDTELRYDGDDMTVISKGGNPGGTSPAEQLDEEASGDGSPSRTQRADSSSSGDGAEDELPF